jgi:hypothetical protein
MQWIPCVFFHRKERPCLSKKETKVIPVCVFIFFISFPENKKNRTFLRATYDSERFTCVGWRCYESSYAYVIWITKPCIFRDSQVHLHARQECQCVIKTGVRRGLPKGVATHHSTSQIISSQITCGIVFEMIWKGVILVQSSHNSVSSLRVYIPSSFVHLLRTKENCANATK